MDLLSSYNVPDHYIQLVQKLYKKRLPAHEVVIDQVDSNRVVAIFHVRPKVTKSNSRFIVGEIHRWPLTYTQAKNAAQRIDEEIQRLGFERFVVSKRIFAPKSSSSPKARKTRKFGKSLEQQFYKETGVIIKRMPRPIEVRKRIKKQKDKGNS